MIKKYLFLIFLWILFLGMAGCRTTDQEKVLDTHDETSSSASVKTVAIGDKQMDYIVFGKGEKPFVILPGLPIHSIMGSADAIAEAYDSFSDSFTVYVFERPDRIQKGYSVRDMSKDTALAMNALGIENADVFGASLGGMIAIYLEIDHPELIDKMILGSTLAKTNDTMNRMVNEWEKLATEKNEIGLLESFVDNVYSETTLDAYREILITSNQEISDEEYQRFSILAEACCSFDCYNELSLVKCPVLVLGSKGDKIVTEEGLNQLAEALDCDIYLYDDSYGHAVYDEASDYKQRCLDFFMRDAIN